MYIHRKRNRFIIAVSLILSGLIILFILTDKSARKTVRSNMEVATANMFIDIANKAVNSCLLKCDIDYNDLANTQTDNDGNITAVTCNTVKLMQIKALLDGEIQEQIRDNPKIKFTISVGSFFGSEYLSGRGPEIPFEMSYDCATTAEFISEFYDAGVNQTIHRIILELSSNITTILDRNSDKPFIKTSYIIAETVIVGKVPSSYTNIALD